ncbi:helix-turn-helix domain-containing protein [Halalkalibacter krulwichiae]|uniref:Helicase Helix-turn-helix domain-containing protein n=1 Tax=Halalkalibacter krulwichiae TaxID=199441 RepID=A0A1X9MA34_9BACI|nr:helix-turn-helix domain-containing protein [Halalkalibacter krulwichiae]ARK30266.1 hypothetical protein BkAM31D_10755 [Halalkalibacter krulwichiae]
MKMRLNIIVTILHAFNGERSIYGAFHLLKGKRSAQTIQDGAFFGLMSYFGLYPTLSRQQLEDDVKQLIKTGIVEVVESERVNVTTKGKDQLDQFHKKYAFLTDLQGWRYHSYSEEVWLRLCLFIQTLLNISSKNSKFFPITHRVPIQLWVKRNLPHPNERNQTIQSLYEELSIFLSNCSEAQAMIFTHQLSGYKKVGLIHSQIAESMMLSEEEVELCHKASVHRLITEVTENPLQFKQLARFIQDQQQSVILTESAKHTYSLLKKGMSAEAICEKRKLKKSTIEDHIVEIAIQDQQFSIREFVPTETEQAILQLSSQMQTTRLRELKEHLAIEVSYFMIRLVLARKKGNYGA